MPLPGGPADKQGNRYERLWTEYQLLRLLDSAFESIRLEEPGVDEAEFVIRSGNHKEFHQAKRAGIRGSWTVASLKKERVLIAISEFLAEPNSRFVFVSGCSARELFDLCEAAKSAESVDEFVDRFLKAKTRRIPFEHIRDVWRCDTETAINFLRRIEVRTLGDQEIEDLVRCYARALFLADPNRVMAELASKVETSIHETVLRDDFLDEMRGKGFVPRLVRDPTHAASAIKQATDSYLQSARRRLIHQTLIPRNASREVLAGIANAASVLVGKAGSGKTACVVEIVESLRGQHKEVLAFRLDRHMSAKNTSDLGNRLGLEETPTLVLAAAAEAKHHASVLIVDQLDAVSTTSGRSSEALDLVESLLEEAESVREHVELHVVIICRSFDWDNDHRLRRLIKDGDATVVVGEFTDEVTKELLLKGGFAATLFQDTQIRLLRVPQNLSMFLDIRFTPDKVPNFNTVNDVFELYWDDKRQLVLERSGFSTDQWEEILQVLCVAMTANQELSVRREVLDGFSLPYLNQMASEGVLVLESNRYGFGHESFFDYCYARVVFMRGSESLSAMLCASEQHLFRRGQVRQVLTYIREEHFERYLREVRALLSDPQIRVHIKDLVFALLADVTAPKEAEWDIWREWISAALNAFKAGFTNEEALSQLAWRRFLGSESWFGFLVSRGIIEDWLKSGNDRLIDMIVGNYLTFHQSHSPDAAALLLEPYLEAGNEWHERFRDFMLRADVSKSRRLFDLFLKLVDDGTLDDFVNPNLSNISIWNLVYGLDTNRPGWVSELLAHLVMRGLTILEENQEEPSSGQLLRYDSSAASMFRKSAESDPLAYVQHVLPVVLKLTDLTARGEAPRRDEVWRFQIRMAHPSPEDECLGALIKAVEMLADLADDTAHKRVLRELRHRNTYVANQLLLAVYRGAPSRYAEEAADTLCNEPWRFDCGLAANRNWFAVQTIEAVARHLSIEKLRQLEDAILKYIPQSEARAESRRRRGFSQLTLLSAIPGELRSKRVEMRFKELKRKFGDVPDAPEDIEGGIVESPIGILEAKRMTDDQWLRAVKRYATDEWRFEGGLSLGGVHELSRTLEEFVKVEPDRFARLAMRFDSDVNELYTQSVLTGLSQVQSDEELKLDLCRKEFDESHIRSGKEIADVIGYLTDPLPDDVVEMINWLATEHPDPVRDEWQEDASDLGHDIGREVYQSGINSTRGRAAISIARMISSDASNLERFQGTIGKMVKDSSSAVLSCVASIFEAVDLTNPNEAMALFLTMQVPNDELLATGHIKRFMNRAIATGYDELLPLIERMICSDIFEVAKQGSVLAALSLLYGHEAEQLVERALAKGSANRQGIAQVASSNIEKREFRETCERWLVILFEDEDADVRSNAATCFRQLHGESLEQYENLIDKFSTSEAFNDDSSSILTLLEESRQRLPGITCLVCERHLERFANESRNLQFAHAADPRMMSTLLFRTYQQHQKDKWGKRALDLIDRFCLEGLAGASEHFEQFER